MIFLVNIPSLSRLTLGSNHSLPEDTLWSNELHNFIQFFFANSARPLFAFMFGISMVLIYEKAKQKNNNPHFMLFRRMIMLFIIGCIHFFYIWHGDILLMYSLDGLILLLFISMSIWPLFLFSLLSILLFNEVNVISINIDNAPFKLGSGLAMLITLSFGHLFWFGSMQNYDGNSVVAGVSYQLTFAIPHLFFFLIGMLSYKIGIFNLLPKYKLVSWIMAICLLLLGYYGKYTLVQNNVQPWILSIQNLIHFSVALGIAFVIILMGSTKSLSVVLKPFTAVGRMAFTNYIMQSLVFVIIFIKSGEGFFRNRGLIDSMPFSILLPLSILFFALQMFFSWLWLSRFHYGPFEWVWRWGTYLKFPTMRKKNI